MRNFADPAPDPALFVSDLQDANKNIFFSSEFLCLFLFEGTFTSFFKDKKSKSSQRIVDIKVFCLFFAC